MRYLAIILAMILGVAFVLLYEAESTIAYVRAITGNEAHVEESPTPLDTSGIHFLDETKTLECESASIGV